MSFAPARAMMSGRRKAPPISISSPRDTIAWRPLASVLSTSRTAEALVLTTVAPPALTAGEIELERDRVPHRGDGGLDRGRRQDGAAEIGVQHRAGEVEH